MLQWIYEMLHVGQQGQSPSVAYGPLSPATNGVVSHESSPQDGADGSHHSGGAYMAHLQMAGQHRRMAFTHSSAMRMQRVNLP